MADARLPLALASLLSLLPAGPATAATFTVTTTADADIGSLREAISLANATDGVDHIVFAIPAGACSGAGVCRIDLASPLPGLTEGVEIDGTTQPRSGTAPENVCATPIVPSYLRVEIVGAYGGGSLTPLLAIVSPEPTAPVTIRGLAIGGDGVPIQISSAGPHRVQCNHIGVTADGEQILPTGFTGLGIDGGGAGAIVGADGDGLGDLAEQNLFVPDLSYGIYVNANSDNRIAGNVFGRAASGTPLACSIGIQMRQTSSRNLVGSDEDGVSDDLEANDFDSCNTAVFVPDSTGGSDNRVVRNRFHGNGIAIELLGGSGTVVRNNRVEASSTIGLRIGNAATVGDGSAGNCFEGNATGLAHEGAASIVFAGNWWGATDGPSGDGPGSGDPVTATGAGSLDLTPFRTDGCVFVPEPSGRGAAAAGALALAWLRVRRRCASSSSA